MAIHIVSKTYRVLCCVCTYYVYVCLCVQIFLYFDELELCNTLRSKQSIHNVYANHVYLTISYLTLFFYVQVLSTSLLVTFHRSTGEVEVNSAVVTGEKLLDQEVWDELCVGTYW